MNVTEKLVQEILALEKDVFAIHRRGIMHYMFNKEFTTKRRLLFAKISALNEIGEKQLARDFLGDYICCFLHDHHIDLSNAFELWDRIRYGEEVLV